ncbi:MAG: hypothetical protein WDW38_007960 [Sanguina aurantia]
MDVRALQAKQYESRIQSMQLREKRTAYLELERVRKEEEAANRLEETRIRAEAEELNKVKRDKEYQVEFERQASIVRKQQDAAKKAYEERQLLLGEELARRTELELRLRVQAEEKKREEDLAESVKIFARNFAMHSHA